MSSLSSPDFLCDNTTQLMETLFQVEYWTVEALALKHK